MVSERDVLMTALSERRVNMVNSQILTNRVTDAAVEAAMLKIPREKFLPKSLATVAYMDNEPKVADGRYLLEPMVFARLLQAAALSPDSLVLDIGCSSGYSTAVLAQIAGNVVGLDSDETLVERANNILNDMGIDNAVAVAGDMAAGLANQGPYDVIFVNGSVNAVPETWLEQLSEGGRITAIQRSGGQGHAVTIIRTQNGNGQSILFDANSHVLPGFEAAEEFRF
jgi:protein-L-isoaspartate(D-aspartate) O-methyltransferase